MIASPPSARTTRRASTFLQEEWLRSLDTPVSNHNVLLPLQFDGDLNVDVLQAAMQALVARHAALRTSLTTSRRGVRQEIWPIISTDLPRLDLSQLSERDANVRLDAAIAELANRPMDLTRAPLWRTFLARLSPTRHVLAFTINHIVFDGASRDVVYADLVLLYHSLLRGRGATLEPQNAQLADFADWERDQRLSEEATRFWREAMDADEPRPPSRPGPHPETGVSLTSRTILNLSPASARELAATASRVGASLASATRTLVIGSLLPYLGDRVVIGATDANRRVAEFKKVVGLLAGYLPVGIDVSGTPTLSELIARVHTAEQAAKRYSAPAGTIANASGQPERVAAGRLFDIVLNYMPVEPGAIPPDVGPGPGCRVSVRPAPLRMLAPVLGRSFSATPRLGYHLLGTAESGLQIDVWAHSPMFASGDLDILETNLATVSGLLPTPDRTVRDALD